MWYCGTYHNFDRHDIGIEQLQFTNNQCYVVPVRLSLRSYATGLNLMVGEESFVASTPKDSHLSSITMLSLMDFQAAGKSSS